MQFIIDNYIWILIIVSAIVLALIGLIAESKGYFKKGNSESEEDFVDIDELSRPKESDNIVEEKKEQDISSDFDEMPDMENLPKVEEDLTVPIGDSIEIADELPTIEDNEEKEEVSEDLYAPFGDQEVQKMNDDMVVNEVVDGYSQTFADIDKIESEAVDIIDGGEKREVADLMKGQYDLDSYDFVVEGAEEDKTDNAFNAVEEEKEDTKKKEEDELKDMWNL